MFWALQNVMLISNCIHVCIAKRWEAGTRKDKAPTVVSMQPGKFQEYPRWTRKDPEIHRHCRHGNTGWQRTQTAHESWEDTGERLKLDHSTICKTQIGNLWGKLRNNGYLRTVVLMPRSDSRFWLGQSMRPRKHSWMLILKQCVKRGLSYIRAKKDSIDGTIGVQFVTFFIYPEGLKIGTEHQSPIILSIIY